MATLSSSFTSSPTESLETVDVYSSTSLSDAASSDSVDEDTLTVLEETYPTVKATVLLSLLRDSDLNDYLDANNLTLLNALSSLANKLPDEVEVNDVLGTIDLLEMLQYIAKFKTAMTNNQWADLDADDLEELFDVFDSLTALGGTSATNEYGSTIWDSTSSTSSSTATGRGVVNSAISSSVYCLAAEKLIEADAPDNVVTTITDNCADWSIETLYNRLIVKAAKEGLTDLVNTLNTTDEYTITPYNQRQSVRYLLASYSIATDLAVTDYATAGNALVTTLSGLNDTWYTYDRNATTNGDAHLIRFASDGALRVLSKCTTSSIACLACLQYNMGFSCNDISDYTDQLREVTVSVG